MHDSSFIQAGPGTPDSYLTLADVAEAELKVQRSRFLAHAGPATTETEARAVVQTFAQRFHDARHVCYGWRLAPPPELCEARSDAGEPAGTAGEPILVAMRQVGLTDTIVVVMRWFGGVKLGTGGLARAYGQAAAAALAAAPRRTVLLGRMFQLTFPYAQQKTLTHLLAAHGGQVRHEDYGTQVTWRVWLPHSRWSDCAAAMTEATRGRVTLLPRD